MAKSVTKKHLLIGSGIALLAVALLVSFGFWIYSAPMGQTKIKILEQLNLPVARVGSGFVGGRELFERYSLAGQIYGQDKNFQPAQAQADILQRLIEIKKLETIAAGQSVQVSEDELNAEYARIAEHEGGNEKFEEVLSEQFHFTPEQFKQKVLEHDIRKTKLAINFYDDQTLNPGLHKTLDQVSAKLEKGGDFAEVAKMHSEDPATRQFGGDSGEIPVKDLVPELQEAIKDAQPGQTLTVTTRYGIYIIKTLNRKEDSVAGGSLHFQSIFLNYGNIDPKVTESAFTKWYEAEAANIKTKQYINL